MICIFVLSTNAISKNLKFELYLLGVRTLWHSGEASFCYGLNAEAGPTKTWGFICISSMYVCRSLLEELKSLNLVVPEVESEDGKEMETASTSHSMRGVLTDR